MSEGDGTAAGGWLRFVLPAAALALLVGSWDLVVRVNGIPPYILPGPWLVAATIVSDWPLLSGALVATLTTTVLGFALAFAGGAGLAIL